MKRYGLEWTRRGRPTIVGCDHPRCGLRSTVKIPTPLGYARICEAHAPAWREWARLATAIDAENEDRRASALAMVVVAVTLAPPGMDAVEPVEWAADLVPLAFAPPDIIRMYTPFPSVPFPGVYLVLRGGLWGAGRSLEDIECTHSLRDVCALHGWSIELLPMATALRWRLVCGEQKSPVYLWPI